MPTKHRKKDAYDGQSYSLDAPFIVLATQNPIEQEGTYRLPEAQLDRFLFKIEVGYPSQEEEFNILARAQSGIITDYKKEIEPILNGSQVNTLKTIVAQLHVEDKILSYIAALITETRNSKALYLGASPRASVAVLKSSKAIAAIRGRDFVTPEDVATVLPAVLCHRIILTPEKEMEGGTPAQIVKDILNKVEIPR